MKKIIISILFALIISCFAIANIAFAENGTTYYVDSENGNDSNSGTSRSQAWKTLSKASSVTYSPGDKILLKAGCTFTGSFTTNGSGTKDNPITLSSYGDSADKSRPLIYSPSDVQLLQIHNVNGWVVENLELSAPKGKGIKIYRDGNFGHMSDITVRNCILHDISKDHTTPLADWKYAAIYFGNDAYEGKRSRHLENITLSNLIIYDCAYGIVTSGASRNTDTFVSEEVSLHQNCLIENVYAHDLRYDAIIATSMNNSVVRNCVCLRTAVDSDPVGTEQRYTAPLWLMQCNNVIVERCEIAGSTNKNDAMAIDFDGYTTNSTYQYIYSHDNVRFINNCVYDNNLRNKNCTVRYCLSINDNKGENSFANRISNWYYKEPEYIDSLKFYNNTIINGSSFKALYLKNSYIANNIFHMKDSSQTFKMNDKDGIFDFDYDRFTGTFTNNYFNYSKCVPYGSQNSKTGDAGFIGTDFNNQNSFMLSTTSNLLNAGVAVQDININLDYYGNMLDSTPNIGCYGGNGATSADLGNEIKDFLSGSFDTEIDTFTETDAPPTEKLTERVTQTVTQTVTETVTENEETVTETVIDTELIVTDKVTEAEPVGTGDITDTEKAGESDKITESESVYTEATTTKSTETTTDNNNSGGIVTVWVIASALIIAAVVIIVCVVIIKKKQRRG